jgi:hypothetical protein
MQYVPPKRPHCTILSQCYMQKNVEDGVNKFLRNVGSLCLVDSVRYPEDSTVNTNRREASNHMFSAPQDGVRDVNRDLLLPTNNWSTFLRYLRFEAAASIVSPFRKTASKSSLFCAVT